MDIEIIEDDDAIQTGISQNTEAITKSSTLFPVVGVWGIVQRVHSEDVSVDVKSTVGIEYRHIKVRSLKWVGANDDRAFGERDIPPVDSKVFVLFPDGVDSPDTAFALCSVVDTIWSMEKSTDNLAVSDKDREYKIVTEAGWIITYDKDTGDYKFKSNTSPVIEIDAKNSDGSVSIKNANGGQFTIDSNGQISLSKSGATVKINSTGGIDITPAPGQAIILNGGVQNVNNLPVCLFSGAMHGTNTGAKA